MPGRKSCVLRLHEPLTRTNWGGRATSLAMARILEHDAGRHIASTIRAPHIVAPLSAIDKKTGDESAFTVIDRLAQAIIEREPATRKLRAVQRAITAADELVVNGEGDFILAERRSLVRTLAMMRAAHALGKPIHLLNCILSYAPERPGHESMIIETVAQTLQLCESVVYRDPASLALHRQLFGSIGADWAPDALFGWADVADTSLANRQAFTPETEGLSIPAQRILSGRSPYVVLSGTSRRDVDLEEFRATTLALRARLRRHGIATVFAGSDGRDREFSTALKGSGTPIVDPNIGLSAAARLLWNAGAIVSGRYHPSILASLGGTPFVLMQSNSHKTSSLYEVLQHPGPAVELPFFAGRDAGAAEIADIVLQRLESPHLGAQIKHVAATNGLQAIAAVTRALNA